MGLVSEDNESRLPYLVYSRRGHLSQRVCKCRQGKSHEGLLSYPQPHFVYAPECRVLSLADIFDILCVLYSSQEYTGVSCKKTVYASKIFSKGSLLESQVFQLFSGLVSG